MVRTIVVNGRNSAQRGEQGKIHEFSMRCCGLATERDVS